MMPGFNKYGLTQPPPRKVKKITDPRKIDKYAFFYEKQAYMIVKPCAKSKKKKRCGGHGHRSTSKTVSEVLNIKSSKRSISATEEYKPAGHHHHHTDKIQIQVEHHKETVETGHDHEHQHDHEEEHIHEHEHEHEHEDEDDHEHDHSHDHADEEDEHSHNHDHEEEEEHDHEHEHEHSPAEEKHEHNQEEKAEHHHHEVVKSHDHHHEKQVLSEPTQKTQSDFDDSTMKRLKARTNALKRGSDAKQKKYQLNKNPLLGN